MISEAVTDNWILQDIYQAFENGLNEEDNGEIVIDRDNDCHSWHSLPSSVFTIDALITLLVNVVLRDYLIVDANFTYVWDKGNKSLLELKQTHIISPIDFNNIQPEIEHCIKFIIDELCVTTAMKEIQRKNEEYGAPEKARHEPHMASLVWGGAVMLARSQKYSAPYVPHPFRQSLIRQAQFANDRPDKLAETNKIISGSRVNLFQNIYGSGRTTTMMNFYLPPIAVEVINESNDLSQLIPVAIQLREKYEALRQWIREYQYAVETRDNKNALQYDNALKSIIKRIESKYAPNINGSTNLSIGFTEPPTVSMPLRPIVENIKSKLGIGIGAMLTKLVLADNDEDIVQKLLGFFGERNSKLGDKTMRHLLTRYSCKDE